MTRFPNTTHVCAVCKVEFDFSKCDCMPSTESEHMKAFGHKLELVEA